MNAAASIVMSDAAGTQARPSVLLVDDNPANLIALSAVLKPLGARLVEAASGAEALAAIENEEFAVALLDVQMPEMDGFEVASRIRAMVTRRELPIIFLTAIHRDDGFAKRGYATGAADYITKPFDAEIVRARVKAFVDLFQQRESIRSAQVALRTSERDDALRRLVAFERISTAALGAGDLDGFLRELLTVFTSAAEAADSATILLRDGDRLVVRASIGLLDDAENEFSLNMGEGFAGRVAAERTALEIGADEISQLVISKWIKQRGTRVLYGVPLIHDDAVVGVAHIGSRQKTRFEEADKSLFRAVVDRAAWAVAQHVRLTRLYELERQARADAEAASRAKDEFLATVSHELRTPLNAILGWTVTARTKAPPEVDRALAVVERNARAQARIVEDILDTARIASGKLSLQIGEVRLESSVAAAVEALKLAADAKRISVKVAVDPTATMQGDPDRIQQIVWNLLSNALKFSLPGGEVGIDVVRADAIVRITVRDSGEGIHPSFLPHVFEPFRQADSSTTRRHAGLGLGLSIVKHVAAAHGGSVTAQSDGPGQGASFVVELPVVAPAQEGVPRPPLRPRATSGDDGVIRLDGVKVLVVDDEDAGRSVLVDVLRDRGAVIAEASSAHSAFEELVRFRPDVIVSDITMPGGDGYGFIRAVRALPAERGGRTRAVAMATDPRGHDGERAIAAGFETYLSKPIDLERLLSLVADLANGDGAPLST